MLPRRIVGWDLGGAHLKVALLGVDGGLLRVAQLPCPLWQGMELLQGGVDQALAILGVGGNDGDSRHAITMTGELVDLFDSRGTGVRALMHTMSDRLPQADVRWYAGRQGFLSTGSALGAEHAIASSNWLASASFTARCIPQALFIDIGSTTTDIVPIDHSAVVACGSNDCERLRHGELLYSGVVRTPLMASAGPVPFRGEWIPQMAEHFALSADVYRLTGELPEHADQFPTADNAEKSPRASARRLARMLGLDLDQGSLADWRRLAAFYAEHQLQTMTRALHQVNSRAALDDSAPLVGAGVGRFLVEKLAQRCARPYIDMLSLFNTERLESGDPADCAPAVAVAQLARGVV